MSIMVIKRFSLADAALKNGLVGDFQWDNETQQEGKGRFCLVNRTFKFHIVLITEQREAEKNKQTQWKYSVVDTETGETCYRGMIVRTDNWRMFENQVPALVAIDFTGSDYFRDLRADFRAWLDDRRTDIAEIYEELSMIKQQLSAAASVCPDEFFGVYFMESRSRVYNWEMDDDGDYRAQIIEGVDKHE